MMLRIKSIFIRITPGWTAAMAIFYLIVLFEIPLFTVISFLPFGEHICNLLTTLFLVGIWIAPALWLISICLMIFIKKGERQEKKERLTVIFAVVLPVLLAAFMLLTDFHNVLS